MKLKKAILEAAGLEYSAKKGFQTSKSNHPKFANIEDTIIKSIIKAFEISPQLQEMYGVLDNIHDIEIAIKDSTVDISFHPENGKKSSLGRFPLSYVSKYINNPKGMESFLMMKYSS